MIRDRIVTCLRELAVSLGETGAGTEWHLFGSVDRDEANASDIDLLILCKSAAQTDELRRAIDTDAFELPLHFCLMTFEEAAESAAVQTQQSRVIFP